MDIKNINERVSFHYVVSSITNTCLITRFCPQFSILSRKEEMMVREKEREKCV